MNRVTTSELIATLRDICARLRAMQDSILYIVRHERGDEELMIALGAGLGYAANALDAVIEGRAWEPTLRDIAL